MPFINAKVAKTMSSQEKESLKGALGVAISILGKSEAWLMVNIEDGCDLYFAGKKMDDCAYFDIKVYGKLDEKACAKMTKQICEIAEMELKVPAGAVYITYQGIDNWGWNNSNF